MSSTLPTVRLNHRACTHTVHSKYAYLNASFPPPTLHTLPPHAFLSLPLPLVSAVSGSLLFGKLSDRIGRWPILVAGTLFAVAALLLIYLNFFKQVMYTDIQIGMQMQTDRLAQTHTHTDTHTQTHTHRHTHTHSLFLFLCP